MWMFKPFAGKEPTNLEGRTVAVGNVKVNVRNVIAEGGFSCVYIARDSADASKQYALKHMICNDQDSLDLITKEIKVMLLLKGHPNVVNLVAHTITDTGRMKEALLLMEFCEKSLVNALEDRGGAYFEERQVLLILRDVCNAVFAMHSQSPPVAHRDLKVENVLLGSNGAWKLCDFGSTSTNHKRFDRPEEMGIEEDNIRKHTTPAYRAPEMWDLYRKEVISEKVDIWALGCLLHRICYLKLAFDGLIKDMLESSPSARPDITQVWFRVNEQLPMELQKNLPDGIPSAIGITPASVLLDEEAHKRTPMMPRRSPPPPPSSKEQVRSTSQAAEQEMLESKLSRTGQAPIGAFWSTQHAQNPPVVENNRPLFEKEQIKTSLTKQNQNRMDIRNSADFSIHDSQKTIMPNPGGKPSFQTAAFNTFVADFDTSKVNSGSTGGDSKDNLSRRKELEEEVQNLKEQLKKTNMEKKEINSKYEELSTICHSQRQEIQHLKQALAAAPASSLTNCSLKSNPQLQTLQREKTEGTVRERHQGMFASSSSLPNSDAKQWLAFTEPKPQPTPNGYHSKLPAGPINGLQNSTERKATSSSNDLLGFGLETLIVPPPNNAHLSGTDARECSSQRFSGVTMNPENQQPPGWANF
ncbi:AP2-associated protein kinase 1-like isoform X3 [Ananas comosus]|uniref:non-specific serine/threonine protein kinase n=1 Tax=Ananas comosus TaxID=4615 RepID=A0A6P5ECM0_ANACO|nr:AP2-associated protein kinase 1-like isoform X3 [Ananas comosus]